MVFFKNLDKKIRYLKYFIKGYGSILNLMPTINDEENLKKDFNSVGKDFWSVLNKEEIGFEEKRTTTAR